MYPIISRVQLHVTFYFIIRNIFVLYG